MILFLVIFLRYLQYCVNFKTMGSQDKTLIVKILQRPTVNCRKISFCNATLHFLHTHQSPKIKENAKYI